MHALHKLQLSFAADIWDEGLDQLDGVILDGRFPADRLFQVYRNNFWIATEDALSGIYCVVKQLVGNPFFTLLVDHFLRSYPPRFGNMLQLGSDLPVFLCDFKLTESLPYLADIARLEWAYHQVFHAADTRPFNTQTLAAIPVKNIPQLYFELSPSSRLVHSPFPIFEIWRVNQSDFEGDQSVDLDTGGASVLLTRPGLVVELQKLEPVDARFLQCLTSGNNLDKATQAALKCSKDFDLEQALARYLLTGILILTDDKSSGFACTNNQPGGIQP
jgi:hypothetical protein